jgi:hypothetical protein
MSAISLSHPTPYIVVFGRDQAGKPHASWFDQASAELATKAATLMNMRAMPVETDAVRELVGTLPRGRVFSSGRAFTPFVKGQLYSRLVELLGLSQSEADETAGPQQGSDASRPKGEPQGSGHDASTGADPGAPRSNTRPARAEDIGMGSLVLATTGPTEGWFEAEVIGINGGMLTLKWCDYVEPTVVRRRHEIGFLPAAQS